MDVHEDDVGYGGRDRLARFRQCRRRGDGEPLPLDQLGQDGRDVRVVVDDQGPRP
jgi:hypothetical protein